MLTEYFNSKQKYCTSTIALWYCLLSWIVWLKPKNFSNILYILQAYLYILNELLIFQSIALFVPNLYPTPKVFWLLLPVSFSKTFAEFLCHRTDSITKLISLALVSFILWSLYMNADLLCYLAITLLKITQGYKNNWWSSFSYLVLLGHQERW